MIRCNGVCSRYKFKKKAAGKWYGDGAKYCDNCELFIEWNTFICPCCGGKLSTRSKRGDKNVKRVDDND